MRIINVPLMKLVSRYNVHWFNVSLFSL